MSAVCGNCYNMCPKLGKALVARFSSYSVFLKKRSEFEFAYGKVRCAKLLSFVDQLSLLLLADLVQDVNALPDLQQHVESVASPKLRQWLEQTHQGRVASFVAQHSSVFVVHGDRVYEKDEVLAPANLEDAVAAAVAKSLKGYEPQRIHVVAGQVNNEVRRLLGGGCRRVS